MNYCRKYFLLCFLSICLCYGLYAQTFDVNRQFEVKSLQEDFQIFKTTLQEAHPSLFRFIDKNTLEQKFDSIYQQIDQPLTTLDFAKQLSFLIAQIQDGHTSISHTNDFWEYFGEYARVFPFYLIFIEDRAYVLFNGSQDKGIQVGSQILSINGQSIANIKKELYQYMASDANVESYKSWRINEVFPLLYFRFIDRPNVFNIRYINPGSSQIQNSSISALTRELISDNISDNFKNQKGYKYYLLNNHKAPHRIEFLRQGATALLTIKGFWDIRLQTFPKFLKNAFELIKIKKCDHLIIDLRDNTGGKLAYSQLLYSYLTDKDFRISDSLAWRFNKLTYGQFTNLAPKPSNKTKNTATTNTNISTTQTAFQDSLNFSSVSWNSDFLKPKLKQKIKNRFTGRVTFLINGGSYSATNLFCVLAHRDKRGIFVGEESGGNYFESTALIKGPIVLRLPHTKVLVQIPWMRFIWAVNDYSHPNRGVVPDFEVKQNIKDLIKGGDSVINFAVEYDPAKADR